MAKPSEPRDYSRRLMSELSDAAAAGAAAGATLARRLKPLTSKVLAEMSEEVMTANRNVERLRQTCLSALLTEPQESS